MRDDNWNRSGRGKCMWPDGSSYDGEWLSDKRHGSGTFIDCCGEEYTGQWNDDVICDNKMLVLDGLLVKGVWRNSYHDDSGTVSKDGRGD